MNNQRERKSAPFFILDYSSHRIFRPRPHRYGVDTRECRYSGRSGHISRHDQNRSDTQIRHDHRT